MEKRDLRDSQITVVKRDDGARSIVGYAAVFYDGTPNTEFALPGLSERIAPGAFDRALKDKQDVRALFNHDADQVLGRTVAGTLKLSADKRGLKYEIDPPDTQVARDLLITIERGDISGSSFAFVVRKQEFAEGEQVSIRVIKDLDLFDVGPVTYPAYSATSIGIRSEDAEEGVRAYEQWKATALKGKLAVYWAKARAVK